MLIKLIKRVIKPTSAVLAFVFVAQTFIGSASAAQCDTDKFTGFILSPDAKSTYAVTKDPLTWSDAHALALSAGGRLAVITTSLENDAIANGLRSLFKPAPLPSSGNKAWIGLYSVSPSGPFSMEGSGNWTSLPQRFTWVSSTSGFTNYAAGQPDNYCVAAEITVNPNNICYGENWVAMDTNGKWSDEGNHGELLTTLPGIVEWPSTTLDCVSLVTPGSTGYVEGVSAIAGEQYCTDSNSVSMTKCDQLANGAHLCPLEQATCTGSSNPITTCAAGETLITPAVSGLNYYTCKTSSGPVCTDGYTVSADGLACISDVYCTDGGVYFPEDNSCHFTELGYTFCLDTIGTPTIVDGGIMADGTIGMDYCTVPAQPCSSGTWLAGVNGCAYRATGVCSSGVYSATTGVCNTCPIGDYPCETPLAGGDQVCSPNSCVSDSGSWIVNDDTTSGLNDKDDQGARAADGSCLGNIYIFNGKDSRCRVRDYKGQTASYLKLAAAIALAATGAGAALGSALMAAGMSSTIASAISSAVISIATNTTIDAATTGVNTQSMITSGVTAIVGAYLGGAPVTNYESSVTSAMFSATYDYGILSEDMLTTALDYAPQIAQISSVVSDYTPAMEQGMLGNYSTTKCCYPDTLSASCTAAEISEAKMQGNGFCHVVGTYCSSKTLSVCMVQKQTSCCYGSMLGRILAEQGRPLVSSFGPDGAWGVPKSPNCRGFTPLEFQSINFSNIDFSEYIAYLTSSITEVGAARETQINQVSSHTTNVLENLAPANSP